MLYVSFLENDGLHKYTKDMNNIVYARVFKFWLMLRRNGMRLWKFNKRSSTLADMSMNRVLLTELIAKGAVVGVVAGFCGATYRYLILESEHLRWQLMEGITLEWALGWLIAMVVFAFIVDRLLTWAPLSGGSGIPQIEGEMLGLFDMKPYRTLVSKMLVAY